MPELTTAASDPAALAGYDAHPPRMGFFTDTSVCIGCKACEVACKEWNSVPEDGLELTGMSFDNTVGLGASTWRHVAFIEQIGRPGDVFRRVRIASDFGKLTALVTDGHLPFPFGRETFGYEVSNLAETLTKAKAAGATVLVEPFKSERREAAMIQFPGGYIAEVHTVSPP